MDRRKWRVPALTLLVIASGCLITFVLFYFLLGSVNATPRQLEPLNAEETADVFLYALQLGNYEQAFSMCSSTLQTELETSAALKASVSMNGLQPVTWKWVSARENRRLSQVFLDGEVKYLNGRKGIVKLELQQFENRWEITFLNLGQEFKAN